LLKLLPSQGEGDPQSGPGDGAAAAPR